MAAAKELLLPKQLAHRTNASLWPHRGVHDFSKKREEWFWPYSLKYLTLLVTEVWEEMKSMLESSICRRCTIQFYSSIKKCKRTIHSWWEGSPNSWFHFCHTGWHLLCFTYKQHLHKSVKSQFTPLLQSWPQACTYCFLNNKDWGEE